MMELLQAILRDGVVAGLLNISRIALFLVPVIVIIEMARYYKILDYLSDKVKPLMHFLGLPKEAAFPLITGLLFGIVLGAAVIIDYSREGFLEKRDLLLTGVFISISHAVIEDAFIFASLGANFVILIVYRFILAVLITKAAAYFIDRRAASLKNEPVS